MAEEREVKEDLTRPAKERVSLFLRWDDIVNMSSSEVSNFRNSDFGRTVGLNKAEARVAGLNVISGQDASKIIERMLTKASKFRGQDDNKIPKLPDWTSEEWEIAGKQIGMISRFRENIGDYQDDEGNDTPKAGALKLWGRDEVKATKKFPNKDEVKERVKELYRKDREEEKARELKKKVKEKEIEKEEREKEKRMEQNKKKTLSESIQDKANYLLLD